MADKKPADAVKKVEVVPQDSSKPQDTEKTLADFFNNSVLSDMSLINPTSKGATR